MTSRLFMGMLVISFSLLLGCAETTEAGHTNRVFMQSTSNNQPNVATVAGKMVSPALSQ